MIDAKLCFNINTRLKFNLYFTTLLFLKQMVNFNEPPLTLTYTLLLYFKLQYGLNNETFDLIAFLI